MEWKPIETAPRDGREILAYPAFGSKKPEGVPRSGVVYWNLGWKEGGSRVKLKPTHWMPIPEGPSKEKD